MPVRILAFLSLAALFPCPAGAAAPGPDTPDTEQRYLELNFIYENVLGVKMDTMHNLALYGEVFGWIGTPYAYSGETRSGTDCSGFVSTVFKKVFGKKLAGCSADIYKEDVTPVASGELKEGDLVFFKIRRKSVSHVGIYLGGQRFVHASTRQGVVISSLNESYYARYFYKAGRINN